MGRAGTSVKCGKMRLFRRLTPLLPLVRLVWVVGLMAGCATPRLEPWESQETTPALYPTHVLTADGLRLPLTAWLPVGEPAAVVLALHGFNDYRRAFEEVGAYLAQRGVAVYAYDQRGFGETQGAGGWFGERVLAADVRLVTVCPGW